MMETEYLIWSHEHGAWWQPRELGYTTHFYMAGRYTRADALRICEKAMPGTARKLGALPELPVRADDMHILVDRYRGSYPGSPTEPWA